MPSNIGYVTTPLRIAYRMVGNDEAASAAHHVEPDQLAPVVQFVAFLHGLDRMRWALVLALELGITDALLAHEVLSPDAKIGLLLNEKAQLAGKIGERFVVRGSGQQDNPRLPKANVFGNRLVTTALAVAQIVAFVDQNKPVPLEVFQALG